MRVAENVGPRLDSIANLDQGRMAIGLEEIFARLIRGIGGEVLPGGPDPRAHTPYEYGRKTVHFGQVTQDIARELVRLLAVIYLPTQNHGPPMPSRHGAASQQPPPTRLKGNCRWRNLSQKWSTWTP